LSRVSLSIKMNIQGSIDTRKMKRRMSGGVRGSLMRFGAYVRQTARRSIRKSKKSSQPGKPPKAHTGHLKKMIMFAYDPFRQGVWIGPIIFRGADNVGTARTLEHGGRQRVKRTAGSARRVSVKFAPRPFMQPAFEQVLLKHRNLFKNILK